MSDKKCQLEDEEDSYTAGTMAACSIMQFFKRHNWQIISFFPNSVCAKKRHIQLENLSDDTKDKKEDKSK